MTTVFYLAIAALAAILIWRAVRNWRRAESEGFWSKCWAAMEGSLTVVWAWLLAVGGQLINAAHYISMWLDAPEVADWINANIPPHWAAIGLTVIGLLTIVARLRSIVWSKG